MRRSKDLSYGKCNSVNSLYLIIINKLNWYIEESNGNKYLTLVSTDESKGIQKGLNSYETKSEILLGQ